MVRVIEEAKPWSHAFTCGKCGSRLEATAEDVKVGEFGGNYAEAGQRKFYIPCPVCEYEANFVTESALTPKLVREINARHPRR